MEQEGCSVSFNPWPPLSSGRFHGLIRGDLKNLVFLSVSRSFSRKIHEPKDLRMRHFLSLALEALIALFSLPWFQLLTRRKASRFSLPTALHVISVSATLLMVNARSNRMISRLISQLQRRPSKGHRLPGDQWQTACRVRSQLSADDIVDVAAYVESQSINGWA